MYILTERQKLFACGALVPIPESMYSSVFQGQHDIAFSSAAFLLARAARSEKEVLRDVVSRILLMSCKRIINLKTYTNFVFEVDLNGVTHKLRGRNIENKEMTIMLECEDI